MNLERTSDNATTYQLNIKSYGSKPISKDVSKDITSGLFSYPKLLTKGQSSKDQIDRNVIEEEDD